MSTRYTKKEDKNEGRKGIKKEWKERGGKIRNKKQKEIRKRKRTGFIFLLPGGGNQHLDDQHIDPQGQLDHSDPEGLVFKPTKGHYIMGSASCSSFSRKQSGHPLIWEQELKLNGLNTKLGRRRKIVEYLAEKPLKARQIITHNPPGRQEMRWDPL